MNRARIMRGSKGQDFFEILGLSEQNLTNLDTIWKKYFQEKEHEEA